MAKVHPKKVQESSVTTLSIMERRLKVLEYRLKGLSTRAIGEKLGVSAMTVSRDLQAAMQDLAQAELAEAKELQTLELARLDSLLQPIWQQATSGSTRHTDTALKIISERVKLLGLDTPKLKLQLALERELETLLKAIEQEVTPEQYNKILAKVAKKELVN
jgi:transposase